jgi:hypothetical protein
VNLIIIIIFSFPLIYIFFLFLLNFIIIMLLFYSNMAITTLVDHAIMNNIIISYYASFSGINYILLYLWRWWWFSIYRCVGILMMLIP